MTFWKIDGTNKWNETHLNQWNPSISKQSNLKMGEYVCFRTPSNKAKQEKKQDLQLMYKEMLIIRCLSKILAQKKNGIPKGNVDFPQKRRF